MDRNRLLLAAVAAYGAGNAALYCSLLPLWEGFDEAFHYGYVQELAVERRLPVLGKSALPDEIWTSMKLAPASHVLERVWPELTTFGEFFALPPAAQAERRRQLENIRPAPRAADAANPKNYEAHQAPLAYALLAVPDAAWRGTALPARVWRLRLFGAILSCLAMSAAAIYLARGLGLSPPDTAALLFLTFSTQMFYAAVCHVANDWLAVPLAVGLFGAAVRFHAAPEWKNAWTLALLLGLGLLTKAYFLAFAPAVLVLFLVRRPPTAAAFLLAAALAGPWYLRNLSLYGSVTGMVESVNGVDARAVAAALPRISWLETIGYMARGSLWTGNNTFSTFSRFTLNLMLALLCAGLVVRFAKGRPSAAGRVVFAGMAVFAAALVYATAQEYVFRKGVSAGASVWYAAPLLVPLLCLALTGFARAGPWGWWLRAATLALWTYVICATYWAKLIPLYGGYGGRNATLPRLFRWYAGGLAALSNVAPAPAAAICVLAGATTIGAVALCWRITSLARPTSQPPGPAPASPSPRKIPSL